MRSTDLVFEIVAGGRGGGGTAISRHAALVPGLRDFPRPRRLRRRRGRERGRELGHGRKRKRKRKRRRPVNMIGSLAKERHIFKFVQNRFKVFW